MRYWAFCCCVWLCPAGASALTINELYYDAVGSDDGKVFVELYGAAGQDLDGFAIEGFNGADARVTVRLELAGAVAPDGLFVIADIAGAATMVSRADLLLDFDFQNGPDSVRLLNPAGMVVDALGYGEFGAEDHFLGEGAPALDASAGQSLARWFAGIDSNNNAADFAVQDPSPGTTVLLAPEPGAAWLLLPLLALSVWRHRRRAAS